MKWKTLRAGETRIRFTFVLLPTRCTDGYTRWLRRLWIREKVCIDLRGGTYWYEETASTLRDDVVI